MQRQNGLRASLQNSRPAVIAQATPKGEHVVQGRGSQGLHIGETLQKALEVAQHGRNLGLLQHDL